MIGLDTNVLLRWLSADEGQSGRSESQVRLVEEAIIGAREECFVNAVVVAETIWVVANVFKRPAETQIEIVERLLYSENVKVSDRQAVELALEEFANAPGGGFADQLIGAINSEAGCKTTLTFDKRAARSKHFTALA
ncbi:PIN domain-containing protein [Vannielia litorea]|uniref:Predicted nucleic-acid-binding protein, contains PIN domain n=1 Tax=Vannielia litorea TaxID=1217970 RepID=A0A1N6E8W7_9RHOB|nr:type II toxin-antitoxin system VapC family toxin [Vannielia litorea]SIN79443.1 Predicted nucleic-acid-binding protein, contains PIN domain [Vannielia litorea]